LKYKRYLPVAGGIILFGFAIMYLIQGNYLKAAVGFFVGFTLAAPFFLGLDR
jgi:uncharacterized membrane protein YjjP (DUF1212 family)